LVESRGELASRLSGLTLGRPYVFEEYIRGTSIYGVDWLADYVSVESAVSAGRVAHLGITARLPLVEPVREGGLVFSVVPDEKTAAAITDLAERAIGAVGITTGLVHTEIKMTGDGPQVIEVNGRLGGSMERLIPRAMGIDPVRLAAEIALGAPPPRDFGEPDRVALVIYVQPPVNAIAVEKMPSPAELRELPGVFRMDRIMRSGQPVDWRNGTLGRICEVWIDAASPDELGERYRAVVDVLDTCISWRRG
jgi:biotin carboxylase